MNTRSERVQQASEERRAKRRAEANAQSSKQRLAQRHNRLLRDLARAQKTLDDVRTHFAQEEANYHAPLDMSLQLSILRNRAMEPLNDLRCYVEQLNNHRVQNPVTKD